MIKQFLGNSALYSAVGILARGVTFFLLPFYTRVLVPSDYGIIDLLLVFGNFAAVTVALEISQALVRFYVDAEDEAHKLRIASTALCFAVAAYTLFALLAIPLSSLIANALLGNARLSFLLPYSLTAIWSGGICYLLLLLLIYQLRPTANAVSNLTVTIVTIVVTIVLVLYFHLGVRGVLAGMTAGSLVGAAVALWFARSTLRPIIDRRILGQMIRFSLPLIPSSVGTVASLQINRIMVMHLMTSADVGLLGVGYRITSIVPLVMGGVQTALTPLVYSNYRRAEAPAEIARIMRVFVFGSIMLFLSLSLFAKEVLGIMTAPAYHSAAALVPALTLASIIPKMCDFAPGLFIAKRTGIIAIINLAAAGVNVFLNLFLIPHWGTIGAAWANCICGALVFGAYIVLGQPLYRISYAVKPILGSIAIAMLFVFLNGQIHLPLLLHLAVRATMYVVALVLFVRIGLIRRQEISRGTEFVISGVKGVVRSRFQSKNNGELRA